MKERQLMRQRSVFFVVAATLMIAFSVFLIRPNCAQEPNAAQQFTNTVGMTMVPIPAGEFMMGSGKSEAEAARLFDCKEEYIEDMFPQHRVGLTRDFYLGAHEVTQGQWESVMGTKPWKEGGKLGKPIAREGINNAASYISWNNATEYCRRLSASEQGRTYRLPTEAEWEYACRAGTTTGYGFGDDKSKLSNYGWFKKNAETVGDNYAHGVGEKRPNSFGLYDMHGNVFEWCSDWYGEDFYEASPGENPKGPASGTSRVLRGGSWEHFARSSRSAYRNRVTPTYRDPSIGFRLVCESD